MSTHLPSFGRTGADPPSLASITLGPDYHERYRNLPYIGVLRPEIAPVARF